MVSVTSASRYVTSASRYQSRSSMYIRGLIPRMSTELTEAVPFDFQPVHNIWQPVYIFRSLQTECGLVKDVRVKQWPKLRNAFKQLHTS